MLTISLLELPLQVHNHHSDVVVKFSLLPLRNLTQALGCHVGISGSDLNCSVN